LGSLKPLAAGSAAQQAYRLLLSDVRFGLRVASWNFAAAPELVGISQKNLATSAP
jgi:hypothetical protein